MKKYEAPTVDVLKLTVNDIIQVSDTQETPEALGRKGFNIGTVNAIDIGLFD